MDDCGYSKIERKILLAQIERRAKYRKEFLKQRTDPYKHAQEAGHVFDPALQRFMSMKAYQYEFFKATPKNALRGIAMILPMFVYGYLIHEQRSRFLDDCRCGRLKYKDRIKKLA